MKKRVGSYKGKPIVELGGGRENILTKNELTTNSFSGSNKYKGEYYRVKEGYQTGYITNTFSRFFIEGVCNTPSMTSIFPLASISETNENSYILKYVKYNVSGIGNVILPTLKDNIIALEGKDAWNEYWKELSKTIEPCTEEEYYSYFTKTINDIIK